MQKRTPAVFVAGNQYQIMVPCIKPSLMWIKIGEKCYYDHENGILRSNTNMHRIMVPQKELDEAGAYTVCEQLMIDRKPYFPETTDVHETEYVFRAVKAEGARGLHLADVHGKTHLALSVAKAFGAIDFLILNGDIINHSGDVEKFDAIYEIIEKLTGGNIPVVFSRGNHDLRGEFAEKLVEYTPVKNERTYYTFKLGTIWGILLDCGEDKLDSHPEYGNTICCHSFREEETEYLKQVIENAEKEYEAEGVQYKIVVSHIPFPLKREEPFNIESEIYTQWCNLLKEFVKPDMILSGHTHCYAVEEPGGEKDAYGQPCTVVVGSGAENLSVEDKAYLVGTGLEFRDGCIDISMIDTKGTIVCSASIEQSKR